MEGFVGSPRDFWGFLFLPPFDHPRHLKLGVLPPPWDYIKSTYTVTIMNKRYKSAQFLPKFVLIKVR